MATLVHTFPQQTSTVTLLQPRPSSASAAFTTPSHSPLSQHQQFPRTQQMSRAPYNGVGNVGSYRGLQVIQPVAPYAFTSTPSLTSPQARQNTHLGSGTAPAPYGQLNTTFPGVIPSRMHY